MECWNYYSSHIHNSSRKTPNCSINCMIYLSPACSHISSRYINFFLLLQKNKWLPFLHIIPTNLGMPYNITASLGQIALSAYTRETVLLLLIYTQYCNEIWSQASSRVPTESVLGLSIFAARSGVIAYGVKLGCNLAHGVYMFIYTWFEWNFHVKTSIHKFHFGCRAKMY